MKRINLFIDVFDQPAQEAAALLNLTVERLIAETVTEFQLESAAYVLAPAGSEEPLEAAKTLAALQQEGKLSDGGHLVLGHRRARTTPSGTVPIEGVPAAALILNDGGQDKVFPLLWQPAWIGRSGAEMKTLAVDLTSFDTQASISRPHAVITVREGQYLIQSMKPTNPAKLNDVDVAPDCQDCVLHDGDRIRVGKLELIFRLS
jgi:hypothetical protein